MYIVEVTSGLCGLWTSCEEKVQMAQACCDVCFSSPSVCVCVCGGGGGGGDLLYSSDLPDRSGLGLQNTIWWWCEWGRCDGVRKSYQSPWRHESSCSAR